MLGQYPPCLSQRPQPGKGTTLPEGVGQCERYGADVAGAHLGRDLLPHPRGISNVLGLVKEGARRLSWGLDAVPVQCWGTQTVQYEDNGGCICDASVLAVILSKVKETTESIFTMYLC